MVQTVTSNYDKILPSTETVCASAQLPSETTIKLDIN